jgi:hypothetical protein
MEDRRSYQQHLLAEALAPYGTEGVPGPHTKLSISLPTELVELVRGTAAKRGVTVSATIGAAIRRMLAQVEQENLDRALEADAEENLAWAQAYLPIAAKLWSEIER